MDNLITIDLIMMDAVKHCQQIIGKWGDPESEITDAKCLRELQDVLDDRSLVKYIRDIELNLIKTPMDKAIEDIERAEAEQRTKNSMQESIPLDAQVSLILAGYDQYLVDSKDYDSRGGAKAYVEAKQREGKITDHIRYYSMEMSSKYRLIVYEDENDNQYYANDGLAPNKVEKVGVTGNLIYMVINR